MKKVLLGISGGNSFCDDLQMQKYYQSFDIEYVHTDKYWMDWLLWSFENVFDVAKVKMPGVDHAQYSIWKIVFEKYIEKYKNRNIDIVAHSLGTTFILKYLVENEIVIQNLHLIAPFVSDDFQPKDFNESTGTFTFDYSAVHTIADKCKNIFVWYSDNDPVCTERNAIYLHQKLPNSKISVIAEREHFNQSTFWELFEQIKSDI
ncbi:MAG: alpha/beta hydrolase [Candidatus Moraniibacteriota bacterium]|nr:MAG: alpha/beta hydrolase [Candidatus Moranbacteria bacterium]